MKYWVPTAILVEADSPWEALTQVYSDLSDAVEINHYLDYFTHEVSDVTEVKETV